MVVAPRGRMFPLGVFGYLPFIYGLAAAGQLPKTGADAGVLGASAAALAGGVAALVAARRRRR